MPKQIEMIRHRSFWNRSAPYALPLAAPSSLALYFLAIFAALLFTGAAPRVCAQETSFVAIIDTRAFSTDILEYKQQVEQLNRKFEASTREVQKLANELRTFEIDLTRNRLNYTEAI